MAVLVVVLVLLLAAVLAAAFVVLPRILRGELGTLREETATQLTARNAEMEQRLQGVNETMDRRLGELDTKVDRRLETAGKTTTQIHQELGRVTKATEEMIERAKDLGRLEQALRPPKARGGFGELLLENLLRDRLPPSAYELQYGFTGGQRVDAVIRADQLVPIDAKFPLDNFERMVSAESDSERQLHEKAFARDVKGHIDAIASKYILPGEGTYDWALMYLPAEAVYYELVSGKTGALLGYAHDRRVFPVSATTFIAYLQVVAFGLKGLQIERSAQDVIANLGALRTTFDRFREDFELVGKHLSHAYGKYGEADKRLEKLDAKLEQAGEMQVELAPAEPPAALPRALDAA
ncbi:MAG TPA: DNA recombination protein RmuC [Gaiellaceae bacterium]|nr:DNA recombination protein RmuC [Gaiellaceae bacterium]